MKKLLGLLLVAVVAFPANAAVIKNVELKGEVQTIASTIDNNIGDFFYHGAKTRAMAGLSVNVWKGIELNTLFQYVYAWGDDNYTNNGFANADEMKLANANIAFTNLFDSLDVTIGRQFYGDEDSPVIYFGPNHYNVENSLYANALDAVRADFHSDSLNVTLLAGKIADILSGYTREFIGMMLAHRLETRAIIWGGDVKWQVSDSLKAQVYGYDLSNLTVRNYTTGYDNPLSFFPNMDGIEHVGVYGAKLSWSTDTLRMSAEYARNMYGSRALKERKDTPYMVKADIAQDIGAVTARGTFLYGKEKWGETGYRSVPFLQMGNYRPGLFIGSLARNIRNNIFSYTNGIRMFNVGMDYRPADRWKISLDGFSFQDRYGRHSGTLEADLTAIYDYNDYVQLFAGTGYAKFGKGWKGWKGYTDATKVQLGTIVHF